MRRSVRPALASWRRCASADARAEAVSAFVAEQHIAALRHADALFETELRLQGLAAAASTARSARPSPPPPRPPAEQHVAGDSAAATEHSLRARVAYARRAARRCRSAATGERRALRAAAARLRRAGAASATLHARTASLQQRQREEERVLEAEAKDRISDLRSRCAALRSRAESAEAAAEAAEDRARAAGVQERLFGAVVEQQADARSTLESTEAAEAPAAAQSPAEEVLPLGLRILAASTAGLKVTCAALLSVGAVGAVSGIV
eukprot:TRINITY_DN2635_c3_g1_i1.p1 TRINITY_DN2635_c3_g1~~TRINITY_DN2635_c3_g1_i1.p1  ORF type:complete len:265 (+),score=83.31 TRINITY_DN2635_c3_g1_i1:49-843(+)